MKRLVLVLYGAAAVLLYAAGVLLISKRTWGIGFACLAAAFVFHSLFYRKRRDREQ